MKQIIQRSWVRLTAFILSISLSLISFAQDKGVDVDISVKKESAWYQNPIVWVIGGAVFILLLVALLRGGLFTRLSFLHIRNGAFLPHRSFSMLIPNPGDILLGMDFVFFN